MESAAAAQDSEVAQWAAKFAAHGGGKIPAELSGNLALDIVLNEVVEQAWLTTGATGAAIALVRDGEMVCRASGGVNSPELGTRLDTNAGLSGACVRTRQIQCCEDALSDPRADVEASRELGMRSVVVLPLLQDGELIGIFEIFSPRAAAFGDHDLQIMEALAQRVLRNTAVRESSLVPIALPSPSFVSAVPEKSSEANGAVEKIEEVREMRTAAESMGADAAVYVSPADQSAVEAREQEVAPSSRGFDWLTSVMGGILVAVALLMTLVFAVRVGWLKASGRPRPRGASSAAVTPGKQTASIARQPNADVGTQTPGVMPPGKPQNKTNSAQSEPRANNARPSGGSLTVYENGKEIFRMLPSDPGMAAGARDTGKDTRSGATVKAAEIVELAPAAAEGIVLHRVEPQYPEQALAQRVQGPVVLEVHIGADGAVMESKIVSGDPLLLDAAMTAVKEWRFKPQFLNGHAVEMQTEITLRFMLPPN